MSLTIWNYALIDVFTVHLKFDEQMSNWPLGCCATSTTILGKKMSPIVRTYSIVYLQIVSDTKYNVSSVVVLSDIYNLFVRSNYHTT